MPRAGAFTMRPHASDIRKNVMSHGSGVLALAMFAALAFPGSAIAQSAPLRVGLPSIPVALDPATALDGVVPFIARQVFDTLVQYREGSSDIEPGLATAWTVSRDGLAWTFRLRDGVRFHDGTLLTSASCGVRPASSRRSSLPPLARCRSISSSPTHLF